MSSIEFIERAFLDKGPKIISGFSRPFIHNLMGVIYGHQFNKYYYGGMIRHTEAAMLFKWASCLKQRAIVLEIGCYGGLSSSYLLSGLKKNNGFLYSIDPFDSDMDQQKNKSDQCVDLNNKPSLKQVKSRLEGNGFTGKFKLIQGFSEEVAKSWNKPIDFLWIDGNHEQAFDDFVSFLPHLNYNARVAIHDAHPRYGYNTVVNDVRKIFKYGVWNKMEHVKSIITGLLEEKPSSRDIAFLKNVKLK